MDFLNTDFVYQNAWNAHLPTSLFLSFFSQSFKLLSHGFTWYGHREVMELY